MKRKILIVALLEALAAGCGGAGPTPADYGMSAQDVEHVSTAAAPDVELVKQRLNTYPSGETPSCPLVNGVYEQAPPGNIQMHDDAGWCWRIYCPTGTPSPPWRATNDDPGIHLPNLTNQTMAGFTWNDRIIEIDQGPGTFVRWFENAYNDSPNYGAFGYLNWTGWEWKTTTFDGNISAMSCGRNY